MLTFELNQTDKHSIKILLRRKNLWFLSRTNLIKTRYVPFCETAYQRQTFQKKDVNLEQQFLQNGNIRNRQT